MREKEGRTVGLYFKVSPGEMALIDRKMEDAGIRNRRAYLRKMAVDGYVVHVDMGSVKSLVKYICSISGNVNQIAKRCNAGGSLYAEDMEDLRKGYAGVRTEVLNLVKKFSEL